MIGLKSLCSVALLGVCAHCSGSVREVVLVEPVAVVATNCSGAATVSARETVFRRAPVRTWLRNRPARARRMFSRPAANCSGAVRATCSGS